MKIEAGPAFLSAVPVPIMRPVPIDSCQYVQCIASK